MEQSIICNLDKFVTVNNISSHYGSALACFVANSERLKAMKLPGGIPSFHNIIFVIEGCEHFRVNNRDVELKANDLYVKTAYDPFDYKAGSEDAVSVHILVEQSFSDELLAQNRHLAGNDYIDVLSSHPVFHLNGDQAKEMCDLLKHVQSTIENPHLFRHDILKYQMFIFQLLFIELLSGVKSTTNGMSHKEKILKKFLYLASTSFKKERHVQFYADKLSISATYLSRVVKELTGNTVYGFLASFLYNEICSQLRTTERSIGEIAEDLGFKDQSALTNFFKVRSNMTPIDYRRG